jgi:hypothetical protein
MGKQSIAGRCIHTALVPVDVFLSLLGFCQSVGGRVQETIKLEDESNPLTGGERNEECMVEG